jgi:hypothetical protein
VHPGFMHHPDQRFATKLVMYSVDPEASRSCSPKHGMYFSEFYLPASVDSCDSSVADGNTGTVNLESLRVMTSK